MRREGDSPAEMWTNRPPTESTGPQDLHSALPELAGHWHQEPGFQAPEDEFDWRRYATALLRYKWYVLAAAVVGTLAGFWASQQVETQYHARSTILIETSIGGEAGSGPIRPTGLLHSESWVDLLRTFLVLDHVVQEMRLYVSSETPEDSAVLASFGVGDRFVPGDYRLAVDRDGESFTLSYQDGEALQRGSVGDSVGPDLGFLWLPKAETLPAGRTVDFSVVSPRDIAARLGERLSTQMDRNGNFLRLGLRGANPERTAATVNAVAKRYVDVAKELKAAKMSELTSILSDQLDYAADQLKEAQADFEEFRVRTATVPKDRAIPLAPGLELYRDPAYGSYFSMEQEQDELRRARAAIEQILDIVPDSGLKVEALEVIPKVRESSALTQAVRDLNEKRVSLRVLGDEFTEEWPEVQELIEQITELENHTVPRLARDLLARLERDEAELARRIGSASSELKEIPPVAIEEARLQGRMDAAEELFRRLQNSYEQARLAAANAVPDVRILDPAVAPRVPISDSRRLRLIVFGILGGLGLGVLGAVVLDRFDPRLRYPEQVSKTLGVPIIGAVPHIASAGQAVDAVIEAFRGVRLNLVHAYGAAGPVLITISSPGSRDGKTFVSTNLALAFADLGHRTLVVDADIRRGAVHKLVQGVRRPGLTDYLAGHATWRDIIQRAGVGPIDFIASGTRVQRGPELLQSPAMSSLVARLRAEYQVILVDCSPLAAGIDPLVMGTLTGNLLLVVRTGETNRALLEHKLDLLEPLPIRLLGAVINGVRATGAYRYYSYQYSYLPGYEAHDEPLEAPRVVRRLHGKNGPRSEPEGTYRKREVWYPRSVTGPNGTPASDDGREHPTVEGREVERRGASRSAAADGRGVRGDVSPHGVNNEGPRMKRSSVS